MRKPNKFWWTKLLEVSESYSKEKPETTEDKMIYDKMLCVTESVEDLVNIL